MEGNGQPFREEGKKRMKTTSWKSCKNVDSKVNLFRTGQFHFIKWVSVFVKGVCFVCVTLSISPSRDTQMRALIVLSYWLTFSFPVLERSKLLYVSYTMLCFSAVQFIDFSHSFFFPSLLILAFVKLKDLSLSRECQRHGKVKKGSFLLLSNFSLGDKARKYRFLDLNPVCMTFFRFSFKLAVVTKRQTRFSSVHVFYP